MRWVAHNGVEMTPAYITLPPVIVFAAQISPLHPYNSKSPSAARGSVWEEANCVKLCQVSPSGQTQMGLWQTIYLTLTNFTKSHHLWKRKWLRCLTDAFITAGETLALLFLRCTIPLMLMRCSAPTSDRSDRRAARLLLYAGTITAEPKDL